MKRRVHIAAISVITLSVAIIATGLLEKPMYELRTEIKIDAPPATVWETLTDASQFAQWNPFIHKMEGDLVVGNQLSVEVGAPGASRLTFTPEVLVVEPQQELRWLGKLLVTGLFDGEHIFELKADSNGTRLVHRESFRGLLVPIFKRMLERDTRPGFELMNEALKQRAESSHLASL